MDAAIAKAKESASRSIAELDRQIRSGVAEIDIKVPRDALTVVVLLTGMVDERDREIETLKRMLKEAYA